MHAEHACAFLGSRSLAGFLDDEMVQAAVIRCVEVIGEAARQVSGDTRERAPQIPWSLIVGMRNILAHDYGAVDPERVYNVVTEHLPELIKHIGPLISTLEREVNWQENETDQR